MDLARVCVFCAGCNMLNLSEEEENSGNASALRAVPSSAPGLLHLRGLAHAGHAVRTELLTHY
jgi:hypothetical protein